MKMLQGNNRPIDTAPAVSRYTNEKLDTILGYAFPVLDHGFVRVVDYMGGDSDIVEAARVSYGKGTKSAQDDQGLINYLMRHAHTSPFEMCEIKLHVKLPVFVARQWIRHRTANVNEYSARYSILEKEFYIPEPQHMALQATDNKQGRGQVLSYEQALEVQHLLIDGANDAYGDYEHLVNKGEYLSDDVKLVGYGLARELARMTLPVNVYTQWYWKTDLHNLFHFLKLRMDSHAQFEIRVYADLIGSVVKDWVPMAASAFEEYKLNSLSFSKRELMMLHSMMQGLPFNTDTLGFSAGELHEFHLKLENMKGLVQ